MRVTEPYTIFKRTLKSGKFVYYYQFRTLDGRRSGAFSTGCRTLAKAKRVVQHLYITGQLKEHSNETFENFATGFFDEDGELAEWRKLSGSPIMPNTLKSYKSKLENCLSPYFNSYVISKITVSDVKNWVLWASERWSPKTINSAQNCLSMIFNNAIEKNLIEKNPCTNIGSRIVERRVRDLLTVEEIRNIYHSDWKDDIKKRVFLIACITGMRLGEILALQKNDVHKTYFDVKHSWNASFGISSTKTKKNRYVPIPSTLNLLSDSDWINPDETGENPINGTRVYKRFVTICKYLNIDIKKRNLNIHTLRNFFISYMKGKNVPEQKIKATVGHTDSTITDWYTYWKPEMLQEVYDAQLELYHKIVD